MSEVKPGFPKMVQVIWDECGTYIQAVNEEEAEKELEFFVHCLVDAIAAEFEDSDGSFSPRELMEHLEYINE